MQELFISICFETLWRCAAPCSTVYNNVLCSKNYRGRISTLEFKLNRFIGLSRIVLLTSLNKLAVKGGEFTIALTSISKVRNDSSFRLVSWVFNKEEKTVLALLICFSYTPHISLTAGRFCLHSIHSPTLSLMEILILCWLTSVKAFLNS